GIIGPNDAGEIRTETQAEIDTAAEQAAASPYPTLEETRPYVYPDGGGARRRGDDGDRPHLPGGDQRRPRRRDGRRRGRAADGRGRQRGRRRVQDEYRGARQVRAR